MCKKTLCLQLFMAVSEQITVFWIVIPCNLVSGYQHFGVTWLHPCFFSMLLFTCKLHCVTAQKTTVCLDIYFAAEKVLRLTQIKYFNNYIIFNYFWTRLVFNYRILVCMLCVYFYSFAFSKFLEGSRIFFLLLSCGYCYLQN